MSRWAVWRREDGSDACAGVPVGSPLTRGGCGSTRARMAAARAHVLKAAAESVWHETFVQVLMLLHTVAEVESVCGSTVSGRDSTAWRYAWMRATCTAMHALLPPVLGCWNRNRVRAPVRPVVEPRAVVLTDWWRKALGRWGTARPPPPPATLAPSSLAVPSEAELDFRDWSHTVARQPPSPAAGEGRQRFHPEADASELPRSGASPRRAMPLERMPHMLARLRRAGRSAAAALATAGRGSLDRVSFCLYS